jgi:dipeptidyl aminopeptidase/acylaminoacyl peptidase
MKFLTRRAGLGAFAALAATSFRGFRPPMMKAVAHSPDDVTLEDFNLSPDGSTVVFQFTRAGRGPAGLGLYDWQSGQLTRIPSEPGQQLRGASFSYDGKRLAAGLWSGNISSQVAVIELSSMSIEPLTVARILPKYVVYPVFQPNSRSVLFCDEPYPKPTGLKLLHLDDHKEEVVLSPDDGFFQLFRPSFVSSDEIYFRATGPHSAALQADTQIAGHSGTGNEFSFRLKFGGLPQRLFAGLEDIESLHPELPGYGGSLSASVNGSVVIGLGLSLEAPKRKDNSFNYEIFQILPNGSPKQLTNLRGYLGFCKVSYDGSTVCFGLRGGREAPTDLFILSLRSGNVLHTNLRERVAEDPAFAF